MLSPSPPLPSGMKRHQPPVSSASNIVTPMLINKPKNQEMI